jgi:hypothetical protein
LELTIGDKTRGFINIKPGLFNIKEMLKWVNGALKNYPRYAEKITGIVYLRTFLEFRIYKNCRN